METFTVSIPEELKTELDKHSEINWPEYIKKRIKERAEQLYKFEALVSRGKI